MVYLTTLKGCDDVNDISKKYSFNLDTKLSKLVNNKSEVFVGDDITITLNIIENGSVKDLTGCTFSILAAKYGIEIPIEQNDKFTIVDAAKGIVSVKLKDSMIDTPGLCILQLIIADTDENIQVQPFALIVKKGLASDIMVEATDEMNTLAELKVLINNEMELLNEAKADLININNKTSEEVARIEITLNSINQKATLLENKVNGIEVGLNMLPQTYVLTPVNPNGSLMWYLETKTFNMKAKELLNCCFQVFIKGKVDVDFQSAYGSLLFYRNANGTISPYLVSQNDRVINGKSISMSCVFGDLGGQISEDTTGFKLLIKSNISKALNSNLEVYGTLLSNGKNPTFN